MRIRTVLMAAALVAAQANAQVTPEQSAANIHAHMAFLASDLLKGREAGSPEYDIAANYVAAQMEQMGLKPMGDHGTYFQHVPLFAYRAKDPGAMTLHDGSGKSVALEFGKDYVVRGNATGDIHVDAPLIFVGFGVVAPNHGRDDFKGLDVKGKIVVVLQGAPKSFPSEERAYYGSARTKSLDAMARGAVGLVSIGSPVMEKRYPFANSARQYQNWGMTWRQKDGAPYLATALPGLCSLSQAGGARLFAGGADQMDRIEAAAEAPDGKVKGFALPWSLNAVTHSETKTAESENIVGVLPGSDPVLKDQYVVLSAHLDHLGITPPVNGDSINNGAMDNASGVATTLEVANLFHANGKAPKRSLLFLVDTAEEKGLIGAGYFARNPTVPASSIASDVDLDMPILTYEFTDVTAYGATHSSLGPTVEKVAARMNVKLAPDPEPEEGIFLRSDHYRFVEQDIPAVFLVTGFANGGEAATNEFMTKHYHKPSDDLALPIRYDMGAKYARLNYEVTRELADDPVRPSWNKGDFFGDMFAGKHD